MDDTKRRDESRPFRAPDSVPPIGRIVEVEVGGEGVVDAVVEREDEPAETQAYEETDEIEDEGLGREAA